MLREVPLVYPDDDLDDYVDESADVLDERELREWSAGSCGVGLPFIDSVEAHPIHEGRCS